jgi:hypothetical protein
MAKHTPGPWWVTQNGVRSHGRYIAHTNSAIRYEGQEDRYAFEVAQRDADKALLAAAPDLLEAARFALDEAEGLLRSYVEGSKGFAEQMAALQPIRDAIAKAEGDQ